MPFKDPAKQKEFQRKWMAERRGAYLAGKACECGSTERLMLVRKENGPGDAHVWSLGERQREQVLKHYVVMCRPCGRKRMYQRISERNMGKPGVPRMLKHADVWAIRGRLMGKETMRTIARDYGLNHRHVSDIANGKVWAWLERGRRKVYGVDA